MENPIEAWNKDLRQCLRDVEVKRAGERRLSHLQIDIEEQRGIAEDWLRALQREREDVSQLASSTFSQFWLKLFGKWDERVGREEKEAIEAK
ncbi:hypothetical protein GE107_12190 [Cohnella sp. CFH 77786]|uniref:hypothetical protein n=1 Tax=Cohnella sp. CFH 77786 TaxID=2662265 RepID=UPI001C60DFD2|nr:hypothetical protein [Cohnella sp. CFH 77786]MBW5446823.1 hypothetical protein [Cohnella sp. CFH 77786]